MRGRAREREREWVHDRRDKEREKGGKKLVETRKLEGGGGQREEKGAVFMLTSEVVQMSQAPENVTASGRKGIRET